MPGYGRKRAKPVPNGDSVHDTPPLSVRQMTLVALATIWVAFSITVGYYVGEPYLKRGDETQQRLAAMQDLDNLDSPHASAAGGRPGDSAMITNAGRAEVRLLRYEVSSLRFWLLLAWITEVVAGGVIVGFLALRSRTFGRRLLHQLAELNVPATQPAPQQNREHATPNTQTDKPPSLWPAKTAQGPPLTALTASLRRSREAIARSKIEMENRSASNFTLQTA